MPELYIDLHISREEMLRYYKGSAKTVTGTAVDGRTYNFPAHILREFMTHTGINGHFRVRYDQEGRFQSIEQLK